MFFTILTFPDKFHPPKFLMTFFYSSTTNFEFPLFSLFQYIYPLFRENYSFPLLLQISPPSVLDKFTCFLHTLRVLFPPTLTMMHLCITQCMYWTPLPSKVNLREPAYSQAPNQY